MDLVSFESKDEMDFVGSIMKRNNVREIWTSGRLCDKEVTERSGYRCQIDRLI